MNKVAFNQKVRPYIANNELDKVAAALEPYVKLRLYEDSFADRILAVRQVTEADLIPEIENDSFYVIGKVEQATEAAVVANFIDRPTERYISGKRYKIPLGKHKTPIARKQKDELMAYDYDILADAADKDVFELGILRDWKLIAAMNECVRFSGKKMDDVVSTASSGAHQIDKIHINRLESVLNSGGRTGLPAKDELKATRLLFNDMTRRDFALLSQPTLGDELAGRVFTEGFTIDRIQGVQYISSIKHRLLTEHEYATLVTFGAATGVGEAITVNGVVLDVASAGSAELAAQKFADAINTSNDPAIRTTADGHALQIVRAEVEGATTRVITVPVADAEERLFVGNKVAVDASAAANASVVGEGFDRYDIVWAFPDEEFIGEIIRISGQDITTEMWKTNGEEMINRVCREWFGLGIGNYNGVAKMRLQRARVLA